MVPPADHGQVVGAQKRDLLQEITEQERVGSDHPSQRRDQGDSLKVEGAIGKEPLDLFLAHSLDVRVSGLADVIIIPQNDPLGFQHPKHLLGDISLHRIIKYGCENRKLHNDVEELIFMRQLLRIVTLEIYERI